MDEFFTTQDVARIFNVSPQTIKNWCGEFGVFLSPTAKPPEGRKRVFTPDDLKVFALVGDFKKRGYAHEDAKLALGSGQRGELPAETPNLSTTVPASLVISLRDEVIHLRQEIETLKTDRDKERGKNELLISQLNEKEQTVKALYKEIATLEAKQKRSEE